MLQRPLPVSNALAFALLALGASGGACAPAPAEYYPETAQVPAPLPAPEINSGLLVGPGPSYQPLSLESTRSAILAGLLARGWTPESEQPGLVVASHRAHHNDLVRIRVDYGAGAYHMLSLTAGQRDQSWMHKLSRSIRKLAGRTPPQPMVAVAVAAAPVAAPPPPPPAPVVAAPVVAVPVVPDPNAAQPPAVLVPAPAP